VSPPPLIPGAGGIEAFHVELRGVTVDVAHCPDRCTDHAFILFQFGRLSEDESAAGHSMRSLLNANLTLLQLNAPTFICSPVGDVFMQLTYPFSDASPTGLFDVIAGGIERALRWRSDRPSARPHPALALVSFA
jgi:hypothetical protein